jgi:hypothetical protein
VLGLTFGIASAEPGESPIAEPSFEREQLLVKGQVDRLIEMRRRGEGECRVLRSELLEAAAKLESLGDEAPDSAARHLLLGQAAMTYFAAAVPFEHDPPDDPLRLIPGEGWGEYVRLAWHLIHACEDGINRLDVTSLLYPTMAFTGEVNRVGAVYGSEFYKSALELLAKSESPVVRAHAGSFVAARSILSDWELACRISQRVYEIEEWTDVRNPEEAQQLFDALEEMRKAFSEALWWCESDLRRALELYCEDRGQYPLPDVLADAKRLWPTLRPYLAAAIPQGRWNWRNPPWLDLETNRFETEPGLRLAEITATIDADARLKPVPVLEQRLWGGYVVGAPGEKPWTLRRRERAREFKQEGGVQ